MPATNFTPSYLDVDVAVGGRRRVIYDFAVHGGAVSSIAIADLKLPNKAIIHSGYVNVITPLTSGGSATIALGLGVAATKTAILNATAVASWSAGLLALNTLPIQIGSNTPNNLIVSVAVAALTAGKFELYLSYDIPTA
jgi:hypothetical protein